VLGQSSGTNFWVRPIYDTNLIRYFSITMIIGFDYRYRNLKDEF